METNRISALVKNRYEFLGGPICQVLLVLLVIIHCPTTFGFKTEKLTDSFTNEQLNDGSDAFPLHRLVRSVESSSQTTDPTGAIILKGRLNGSTGTNNEKYDNRQFLDMVQRMQDLEKQITDLKNQQFADKQANTAETKRIQERLDRGENASVQLVKKFSVAVKNEDMEAMRKALKDDIADNRRISSDMMEKLRARLDRDENLFSQLVEKVAVASKKTEDNAQRIDAQEAASGSLKNTVAGIRNTVPELEEMRGRLDSDESNTAQLVEKVTKQGEKIETLTNRVSAEEAISIKIRSAQRSESGKVEWKLSEYKSNVNDAFASKNAEVFVEGPTFYTAGIGYRFGINYAFDGQAVRVGIHPAKGVFDDFLKWPFVGNITVTLVDQNVPADNTYSRKLSTTDPELSKACAGYWVRYYGVTGRPRTCSIGLLYEDGLKQLGLVKDDSLIINVEVVAT